MLLFGALIVSGCASPSELRKLKAHNLQIERELRVTRTRLEMAREHQSILKTKLRLLESRGAHAAEPESLAAFAEGGARAMTSMPRQTLSHRPMATDSRPLPVGPSLSALDSIDQVLYRSVLGSLNKGAREQAFRDLLSLEKSYPESTRIADGYFQLALSDYRASRLIEAEQGFAKVLTLKPRPRLHAGALLMTALFVRSRDADSAKRKFELIVSLYPQSVEAKRASLELVKFESSRKRKTL